MTDKALTADERADRLIGWFFENSLHAKAMLTEHFKSAEAVASGKARMEALVECGSDRSEGYEIGQKKGFDEGFRAGQEEMRERAAKVAFSHSSPLQSKNPIVEAKRNTADSIGQLIRYLPIKTGTEG